MERRYAVWDVFTSSALSGNPLAIVLDAGELSSEQMQAIAREFNLSETVFVLPPRLPAHTAHVRIFTPAAELPFAGHPTVGVAIQLADDRISGAAADCDALIVLEEEIGSIRVGVVGRRGRAPYAEFDVPRLPELSGAPAHDDRIAASLGLAPGEIGFANHKPSQYDAGIPFTFVPVRDLSAMSRAHIVAHHWEEAFHGSGGKVYLYCRETFQHNAAFHARMFAPSLGVSEDPATGSAAAAFSAVIHRFDILPEGTSEFAIEQGIEMGRPSEIKLEIEVASRKLKRVRIGGFARLVMRGKLFV
ncbi:PhzF family phenazine biosynthesis protein [Rhodomicrobium sp. Az07]|uniref:PhzF family phenazine biosynthesis protein n=1 Tax=Rhodomicrobium sp. Az07 TaxID=2839034 RepID=UPI001BE65DF3|nr:PhzF family phenazine biosynthesis protein [Rhodomicrobium sp. Az07]MBT3070956.1 PhzF family phenazine biosynthesis protein [Rhodomicrobium sp. Az07]